MEHQKIVEKVRRSLDSRNSVIKDLYTSKKLKASINSFILKNSGTKDDVEDLLTHGVMTFIKQCYRPLFELKNSPEGYIFTIVKYEWMKRRKGRMIVVDEEKRPELTTGITIEQEMIGEERMEALRKAMRSLDDKCRKVLTLWSSDLKMREIALQMGYKSEGMARKKKHECLGKLKLIIKDI